MQHFKFIVSYLILTLTLSISASDSEKILCPSERLKTFSSRVQSYYASLSIASNDELFKSQFLRNMKTDYDVNGISFNRLTAVFKDCKQEIIEKLEKSFQRSITIDPYNGTFLSLYRGHIFLDAFFKHTVNKSEIHIQPWVEWNQSKNSFQIYSTGASAVLFRTIPGSKIYRGASRLEFNLLKLIKHFYYSRLTNSEIDELIKILSHIREFWWWPQDIKEKIRNTSAEIGHLNEIEQNLKKETAEFLVSLVSSSGVMMGTPQKEVGAYWAFIERGQNDDKVLEEFNVNINDLPTTVLAGMYAGIEHGYFEVGLISPSVRLYFLQHLNESPYEEADGKREFPNLRSEIPDRRK